MWPWLCQNGLDELDRKANIVEWKLAEAKNKLSEVVRLALAGTPQRIQRRKDAVVVLDADEYDRLTGKKPNFVEFLLNGPDWEGVDLTRDKSPMRDVDL